MQIERTNIKQFSVWKRDNKDIWWLVMDDFIYPGIRYIINLYYVRIII